MNGKVTRLMFRGFGVMTDFRIGRETELYTNAPDANERVRELRRQGYYAEMCRVMG